MKYSILYFCLLFGIKFSVGQVNYNDPQDRLYYDFKTINDRAKTHHFKTINISEFDSESDTGRFSWQQIYDTSGKLINVRWYYGNLVNNSAYLYDSLGRIKKILGGFEPNYYYTEIFSKDAELVYGENNLITSIKTRNEKTYHYSYYKNGRIKFKIGPMNDTFFYIYRKDGSSNRYKKRKNIAIDTTDKSILNNYGCNIGWKDTSYTKYTRICDSNCRVLRWKSEIKLDGKWVVDEMSSFHYENDTLITEIKYLHTQYRRYKKPKYIIRKISYQYNSKGCLSQIFETNNRGYWKITKYEYDYFE